MQYLYATQKRALLAALAAFEHYALDPYEWKIGATMSPTSHTWGWHLVYQHAVNVDVALHVSNHQLPPIIIGFHKNSINYYSTTPGEALQYHALEK